MRSRASMLLWMLVALMGAIGAKRLEAEEPIRLRILSYNIHHAEGVDGRLDLERIARVILSVEPDLVALQEVDKQVARSNSIDQPSELARLTNMQVAFGANIELQGGHYGNAVLSRFPVRAHKNHRLPNFDDGEQRGVLMAEISLPALDQPLLFLATHLDHRRGDGERVASAKFLNQLVAKQTDRPALLTGDLNDVHGSAALKELHKFWMNATKVPLPTIPVAAPTRQIDFVLCRPEDRWRVVEVKVLDESVASDHRPILAVLELLPAETLPQRD